MSETLNMHIVYRGWISLSPPSFYLLVYIRVEVKRTLELGQREEDKCAYFYQMHLHLMSTPFVYLNQV